MKFYFLHIKSNEVGTTLKHPETINGNVKNLSKRIEMKDKGNTNFYFKNLTLPLGRVRGGCAGEGAPGRFSIGFVIA